MQKNVKLSALESQIEQFTDHFIHKYFKNVNIGSRYWVGDIVGGVLFVNEYFFSLNDIMEFIRHDYSRAKMFEYMEYRMSDDFKKQRISIRSYKWYHHDISKEKPESL